MDNFMYGLSEIGGQSLDSVQKPKKQTEHSINIPKGIYYQKTEGGRSFLIKIEKEVSPNKTEWSDSGMFPPINEIIL